MRLKTTKPTIGFIGAGNMGLPMVKNLIKKGFQVKVYDINPKITKKLEKDNIKSVNNLRAVANNNFIISILPDTQNVESVFNFNTGINSYLKPGTIVVDMSTISSSSAIEIGKKLQKEQIENYRYTMATSYLTSIFSTPSSWPSWRYDEEIRDELVNLVKLEITLRPSNELAINEQVNPVSCIGGLETAIDQIIISKKDN